MDPEELQKALGETGTLGLALLLGGILVLVRENRRAALGAVALVVGYALIGHGLTMSMLRAMGMDPDDVF